VLGYRGFTPIKNEVVIAKLFLHILICYGAGNLYDIAWITTVLEVDNFLAGKKSTKHINMGSSFEDLVATSPTVKTDFLSDKRFEL
jgi:hypothetical protein